MIKIYVGWKEGDWGSGGYLEFASLDKFVLIKKMTESSLNADDIGVFDSETMELLYECDCLHSYTDKHWCICPDCKSNDEAVRYLVETKQGNYLK